MLLQKTTALAWILVGVLLTMSVHAAEFSSLRYDDNFTAREANGDPYSQLKHTSLGGDGRYLSIGGDLRERAEFYSHTHISTRAQDDDLLLLHRLLMHADLHWDQLRFFAQLGNHEEFGREPQAKPSDIDHLDLRQAFVDVQVAAGENDLMIRAGRQEMALGASRLITARDGPNIRLAFDGLRVDVDRADWKITAVAVRPAENTPARFDDGTIDEQSLWGVYSTYTIARPDSADGALRSDIYYFRSLMDDMRYDRISGDESRHTVGLRFYGSGTALDSDVELILQHGVIAGFDIHAFALATDTGWTWRDQPWKPRLGLRTDIISGDRDPHDGTLGTFNALYPNGSYFSEASVLAQANLLDFAVSVTLKPRANISLSWTVNPLWRYSTRDALYSLPLSPLIAGDSSGARYIGTQNQWQASWQYNPFIGFKLALVKFNAGEFVQRTGGQDLDYVQFASSLRF